MRNSLQESGAAGSASRPGCLLLLPHMTLAQSPWGSDHRGMSVPFPHSQSHCLTVAAGKLDTQSHLSKYTCAQTGWVPVFTPGGLRGTLSGLCHVSTVSTRTTWPTDHRGRWDELLTLLWGFSSFRSLQTQMCKNMDLKHDNVRISLIIADAWCYAL